MLRWFRGGSSVPVHRRNPRIEFFRNLGRRRKECAFRPKQDPVPGCTGGIVLLISFGALLLPIMLALMAAVNLIRSGFGLPWAQWRQLCEIGLAPTGTCDNIRGKRPQ